MRRWKLLLFLAVVLFSLFFQNPASLVSALERVGVTVIICRGLIGHYHDFVDALDGKRRKR